MDFELNTVINDAQEGLRDRLLRIAARGTGITEDDYVRYLSMQYYLTRDVQRDFLMAAAHHDLCDRRELREYLFKIGLEEESHFEVAVGDLQELGRELLPEMLDMRLWHLYFSDEILRAPFVRIGGHCVLETIPARALDVLQQVLMSSPFITSRNTRFLMMHLHGDAPHGDRMLALLDQTVLSEAERSDLLRGARAAEVIFLRAIDWALADAGSPAARTAAVA